MTLTHCPKCAGELRPIADDTWECLVCDRVWFILGKDSWPARVLVSNTTADCKVEIKYEVVE